MLHVLWEIVSWGAIGVALAFIYVIGTFNQVSGTSMENTLSNGTYVVGISQYFTPKHGDIVTANPIQTGDLNIIKRVIAIEGDQLTFSGSDVYLNGEKLDEHYILEPMDPIEDTTIDIPTDHVWIMGDNRNNSADSRDFGAVSVDDILAKRLFHYNPITIRK